MEKRLSICRYNGRATAHGWECRDAINRVRSAKNKLFIDWPLKLSIDSRTRLIASLRSPNNQHIKVWGPAGLNDYDFHARFQNPAGPFFQSADRHATNTPALSPHIFAAANPVRFTDPSGLDIYSVDINGNVVQRIDYEKDVVVLHGNEDIKTKEYEKGTIEKSVTKTKNNIKMDFLKITNNESAIEIYEFLVENTEVEISLISYEVEGKKEYSYIASSHQKEDEIAGIQIIADNFVYSGDVPKEFIHCHQSGYLWPSDGDRSVVKKLQQKYNIMFISKIYTKERYEKLGNYKTYTPNSAKLTTEFFNYKYKNPKAPSFY